MSVSQVGTFAKTMADWLGEGLQPDAKAQDRADICTGRLSGTPCRHNYLGKWLVSDKVAEVVKAWIEAKNHLNLQIEGEERLGHCEICHCKLNLKIHVPLATTLKHTAPETLAHFQVAAPWCWINKEK